MDIEQQVFSIFASFIQDLTLTFPEIKSCLYRNYEKSILAQNSGNKLDDYPKIKDFLDKIQKYEKMISDKDEQFFNLEIDFLEEISFKRLWEKQISDTNRATLWKYLQTFTIININLKSSQDLKNALESIGEKDKLKKEEIKTKEVAKDLKKLKKLSEDVQQDITEDEENELEEMLSGFMESGIGDIAKEVAENMNIDEIFGSVDENSNPMDIMQQMMNPEKMGKIFQNIGSVMEKKKESGDITDETLKEDAEKMYGSMSNNPMFSNMMQSMQSMQSMSGGGVPESKSSESNSPEDKGLSKEEKRKKLKQKLKEKEEKRTKK